VNTPCAIWLFPKYKKKVWAMQKKKEKNGEEIKACSKSMVWTFASPRKKRERKKDSPYPKKRERERVIQKIGVHTKIHKISTHLHILIRLHDSFLLGSSF
jgi:hypothetical protein